MHNPCLPRLIPVLLVIISISCTNTRYTFSAIRSSAWPEITTTMKPWTRWWWMGNAVDRENITRRMEEFAQAGIGGVEITPIYGVKGYEDNFIQHLSPEWMEMLIHTLDEAKRLGIGCGYGSGDRMALWWTPGGTRICCRKMFIIQALSSKQVKGAYNRSG